MSSSSVVTFDLVLSLTVMMIDTTIVATLLSSLIKHQLFSKKKETSSASDGSRLVLCTTASGFILYFTSCLFSLIGLFIVLEQNTHDNGISRVLVYSVSAPLYLLGQWMLLFIFVTRIDVSFRSHHSLRYSPQLIKFLYFMVILLITMIVAVSVAMASGDNILALSLTSIWAVLHFGFSVLLVVMYLKKIFIVMHARVIQSLGDDGGRRQTAVNMVAVDTKDKDSTSIESENENRNGNKQLIIKLETVTDITRYALLVSIAIATTFICLIVMLLIAQFYDYADEEELGSVSFLITCTDSAINSGCLFLLFTFNRGIYNKLCSTGHAFCERKCVERVVKKMSAQNKDKSIDYATLILKHD